MTLGRTVRWGILGTANIARNLFLPSLREAGGDPAAVAGRDSVRTEQWAAANGIGRADDTFTRLLGTGGQIHVTNPFHPRARDTFLVCQNGRSPVTHRAIGPYRQSFTPLIRHIHAVLRDEEEPRLLAVDTALGSARALHDLAESSRQG